jgi:SET domain-containing protein
VDGLRVGSWTRFFNHSCSANVEFVNWRVGQEARFFVVVAKDIRVGEEILVDYGSDYWDSKRDMGGFCGCAEVECKYSGKGRGVKKTRCEKPEI